MGIMGIHHCHVAILCNKLDTDGVVGSSKNCVIERKERHLGKIPKSHGEIRRNSICKGTLAYSSLHHRVCRSQMNGMPSTEASAKDANAQMVHLREFARKVNDNIPIFKLA